ncbi:MAG: serine hydrolase, partial [Proteobacteria bacterium]|nr:serine hydrolase [Pseudomonadota bacterium]
MKITSLLARLALLRLISVATLLASQASIAQSNYYPAADNWERRTAESVGMDSVRLAAAVELAIENTVVEPHDMSQFIERSFGREPHFSILGPVKRREQGSGLIVKNGYIVAEWGDINREDMTFSVSKSYLSTMAGLALDDGLIKDVDDRVKDYFSHQSFNEPHNESITWAHFLTQSSDWSGTLWGKPDWADRPFDFDPAIAINREMHVPGTFYKYNDTRVNMLAYSLLNLWRQPLDGILKERIM